MGFPLGVPYRSSLTMEDTTLPSARPLVLGITYFITFPMLRSSPQAAIASFTIVRVSSSDSCYGKYFFNTAISAST